MRALQRIGRQQICAPVPCGEISHDDIRLPDDRAAVIDYRDHANGIHGSEYGVGRGAGVAAPVFALELQTQLLAHPQNLANVDGGRIAVDLQHGGRG